MSEAENLEMPFQELEGAYVTLINVGPTEKLASHFAEYAKMCELVGHVESAPDTERLAVLMEDDETLFVWEIRTAEDHIGYAFFVSYDGPPFIALFPFGDLSHEAGHDCLMQLAPVFFANTDGDGLFFYLQHPVDPEAHELLIDGGFDVWEENPTLDNDAIACYVLERYTYDAYYGEEADGDFEEAEED
jgi:hypothetical protein